MDDFDSNTILECRSEWCEQFVLIVRPHILEGFEDIFNEAVKLCKEQNQMDKYLITFQNMLNQIPKWSQALVEIETKRICEKSKCNYLESILSAIHICQLKVLSAVRVGQQAKKIDIDIPQLSKFIHKIYINIAREFYKCPHLFAISTRSYHINPIDIAKNKREINIMIREGILETLRKNMPIEELLRAYLDPTEEEEIMEKIEEVYVEPEPKEINNTSKELLSSKSLSDSNAKQLDIDLEDSNNSTDSVSINKNKDESFEMIHNLSDPIIKPENSALSFNNIDTIVNEENNITTIEAPKTIERLNEISELRNIQRKSEEDSDYDDADNFNFKIMDSDCDLSIDDLFDN